MATASKLIIVESPAKARTIAKFLGRGYKVEASQGHVRDLPKSQLGVDVDQDFAMKYITIHGRGKILTKIRKEAKNASKIFLATDPDREGEAISWHLAQTLGMDVNVPCRIEFHEVTQKAVETALKNPRPIDMERVDAQQARRALDRLVGYKISPLLWAKVKKGLSAGRAPSGMGILRPFAWSSSRCSSQGSLALNSPSLATVQPSSISRPFMVTSRSLPWPSRRTLAW